MNTSIKHHHHSSCLCDGFNKHIKCLDCGMYLCPVTIDREEPHKCEGCGSTHISLPCPNIPCTGDFRYDWTLNGHKCSRCGFFDGKETESSKRATKIDYSGFYTR